MTFILVPKHGEDVQVNAWNWRPTLELLRNEGLINTEDYKRMDAQGCGGKIDERLAVRIADFIERRLAEMKPGERMRADLAVASKPKKRLIISPRTRLENIDANEIYSASYEWLVTFKQFCRNSGGFEVH